MDGDPSGNYKSSLWKVVVFILSACVFNSHSNLLSRRAFYFNHFIDNSFLAELKCHLPIPILTFSQHATSLDTCLSLPLSISFLALVTVQAFTVYSSLGTYGVSLPLVLSSILSSLYKLSVTSSTPMAEIPTYFSMTLQIFISSPNPQLQI